MTTQSGSRNGALLFWKVAAGIEAAGLLSIVLFAGAAQVGWLNRFTIPVSAGVAVAFIVFLRQAWHHGSLRLERQDVVLSLLGGVGTAIGALIGQSLPPL